MGERHLREAYDPKQIRKGDDTCVKSKTDNIYLVGFNSLWGMKKSIFFVVLDFNSYSMACILD